MSKDELKSFMISRGSSSGPSQSWHVADKIGRVYTCRTHPVNTYEYVFYLDEGTRQNLQLVMTDGEIRLLRELLNMVKVIGDEVIK